MTVILDGVYRRDNVEELGGGIRRIGGREAGEEIIITRRGKAIARLVPERPQKRSAAAALQEAWALGGLDLPSLEELPATDDVPLD